MYGRFNAFEEAHRLDPGSSGRGLLRQFKTVLLQRLYWVNNFHTPAFLLKYLYSKVSLYRFTCMCVLVVVELIMPLSWFFRATLKWCLVKWRESRNVFMIMLVCFSLWWG